MKSNKSLILCDLIILLLIGIMLSLAFNIPGTTNTIKEGGAKGITGKVLGGENK